MLILVQTGSIIQASAVVERFW